MADPFAVLARAIDRKSNLRLERVKVTGVEDPGPAVEITYRGATVHDVPYTGSAPQVNDLVWMLVDDGVLVILS